MELLNTIGWRATGLRNRLSDQLWERRLGISTMGWQRVDAPDANPYATFAYRSIFRIIDALRLQPEDVFIDIGCGKGRVVCCAARYKARKIIGIDIDPNLCDAARMNLRRLRGRRSLTEIINQGAQEFYYDDCTAFFLFNSFGPTTVGAMLEAIARSLRRAPRRIRFAYVNPCHEQLLRQSSFLAEYDRWRRRPWTGLKFDVSFWRSVDRGE
jgi:SAM-dependent methyltransferase